MFFHQRFVPGLSILSYIVGDEKTGEAAVVDPTRDVEQYLEIARQQKLTIRYILETHVHADFVSGAVELKHRLHDQPTIVCSGLGGEAWTPPYADRVVNDGDSVRLGQLRLQAMHTPGHTPEHICWALYDEKRDKDEPWLIFTGDFLFVGDVGRPDLLGEAQRAELAEALHQSVFERIAHLPDHTEIYPGHGPGSLCGKAIGSRLSSTLGYERRNNAALQPAPQSQWTRTLLENMPLAPSYFKRMKQVNATGPAALGHELPGLERITADQLHARDCSACLVLDIRTKEAFAGAHVPGSINIPLGGSFATWAGWVLPADQPLTLVADDPDDVPEAVRHLIRVGLDHIDGYLAGGIGAWEMAGYELAQLEPTSVQTLKDQLKGPTPPLVLDVRTDVEWQAGHIDGAMHIHGGELKDRLDELPKDRPIAVVCGSGYRGSIAASLLRREGHAPVMNVLGGMTAWQSAHLPVTDAKQKRAA
jgi:hydroxyacylglutathione hydrolase